MSSVTATLLSLIALVCWANCSHSVKDDLAPVEVDFRSLDYRNVLYWKHPHNPVKHKKYFVQHKVYGDKEWTNTKHCQGIQSLQCDLSQETSDPREWYYARVRSLSAKSYSPWVLSPRFHPHWDTSISPPHLKATVTGLTIMVQIRPPRTPFRGPKGSRLRVTKLQKLTFRIYVMHNDVEQEVLETDSCSKELEIPGLRPKTTYCLQAVSIIVRSSRKSARGPSLCINTN
ncbi:interleukin-22 receptor subunit alpha-2 [Triplophysa dalaica]|uniref:interleukin-22 receptor subunit alpha-2 n=1 Tax=Triplophysa dalaica TaxID=1582913 RepID=UPI0024DFDBE0|nr:interleukin-22 receptor subunit alpha-2 [Triplophysa dalaica]